MPIVITKPIITTTYYVVDELGVVSSSYPKTIEINLIIDDFIQALSDLIDEKNKIPEKVIISNPVVTATYLVVDSYGTVSSSHPQTIEMELTGKSFTKAFNALVKAKNKLELTDEEIHMLLTTGNIVSLGNVQAATLGVQSQYQFPTAVGVAGQVIGYQGVSQLAWVNAAGGAQGYQGNQGAQGYQGNQGVSGAQGYQGNQGYQGDSLSSGYQGYQGSGLQGFQGAQGSSSTNSFKAIITGNTLGVNSSLSSGTATFVAGNNITFSQSGNAVTINAAGLKWVESYNFMPFVNANNTSLLQLNSNTSGFMTIFPFNLVAPVYAEYAGIVLSATYGTGGAGAFTQTGTLAWGIYTRSISNSSTQMSLAGSNSLTYVNIYNNSSMTFSQATTTNAGGVYSYGSTTSAGTLLQSNYTGLKLMLLGLSSSLSVGQYWLGLNHVLSTAGGNSGLSLSLAGLAVNTLSGLAPWGSISTAYTTGSNVNNVIAGPWYQCGIMSSAGLTGVMNSLNNMTIGGVSEQLMPYLFFGSRA